MDEGEISIETADWRPSNGIVVLAIPSIVYSNDDKGSSRIQHMGGEKERSGKKRNKKEQGCFERLLRMSESRNSQFGGSGANQDFK